MKKTKLTSVKILESLYNKFKRETISNEMNLQKLTNRSVHLYLNDSSFRDKIEEHDGLAISSSKL